jgi:hypothetical protein
MTTCAAAVSINEIAKSIVSKLKRKTGRSILKNAV